MKRVKDHRYLYRRGDAFYFRRAVPDDAVNAFDGRREVQKSLGQIRLSEARHRVVEELAAFEQKVALATGIVAPLSMIEIGRLGEPSKAQLDEAVRAWLADRVSRVVDEEFVGEAGRASGTAKLVELDVHSHTVGRGIEYGASDPEITTSWVAEAIIEANGWRVQEGAELWRHLIRCVGRAQIEASSWQAQDIKAEPRAIIDARFSPEQYRLDAERQRNHNDDVVVSLSGLLDGYVAEAKPAPATVKAWKRQFAAFTEFVGHDDANKVKLANIVSWKDRLLHQPNAQGNLLSAKTVRDTYISVLKTVFKWAAGNGKVGLNPTLGVQVIGPRAKIKREKGLNDAEALIILNGTMAPPEGKLSKERALARRWVPWICAYTGARVNEITQLRGEDIVQIRGIWTILITPEAGSVKDGRARTVAMHPHLVAQGLPSIFKNRTGHIFFDPTRHRGGTEGNPQYKKVGEHLAGWVRKLGVNDPDVQPNHGWRHRFKTQARLYNLDPEIRDVIQGC